MDIRQLGHIFATRWRGSDEAHKAILRGMGSVIVFAMIGKLAGAGKEIAVAAQFGVSPEVDAYLFVFNLVSWPLAVWFSVLTVILIPLAARIRHEAPDTLPRFRREILGLTLVLAGVLSALGHIALPYLLSSQWLGLPPQTVALAGEMVPVMAWVIVPGMLAGLYSVWMMSAGGAANTFFEGLPSIGILVAILTVGGTGALVWGTLIGTIAQFALVAAPMRLPGERHWPALSLSSPHWPFFWQAFGIMILGQAIMSLSTVVDQFFAAPLAPGSLSTLGFSSRIIALIHGMLALVVPRAMLPVFSRAGIRGEHVVRALAMRWAGIMAAVGVLVSITAWLLSPWAVQLLFERGTFTPEDTVRVASVLRFGLVQVPFYLASLVFVSMHASSARYKLLFASGVLGLGVKVIASLLLLPVYGVGGLMLAQAAVYAANLVLLAKAGPR